MLSSPRAPTTGSVCCNYWSPCAWCPWSPKREVNTMRSWCTPTIEKPLCKEDSPQSINEQINLKKKKEKKHTSFKEVIYLLAWSIFYIASCACEVTSVMSDSVTQWTRAHQAPLPMGFPWQEHWSGLPFPSPGDLSNPWIELRLLSLLHWQAGSLPIATPGKPQMAWWPEWKSFTEMFQESKLTFTLSN